MRDGLRGGNDDAQEITHAGEGCPPRSFGGGAGYLSQNDSIMWTVEADPLLRSTVVELVVLDRPPDWDALNERMERVTHLCRCCARRS